MVQVGLYVHVPFCAAKCGYCDFYSRVPVPGQTGRLVDALLAELAGGPAGEVPRVGVRTVFVGGGTPTVLPLGDLSRLFEALGRVVRRDGCRELTVEANPATLDDAKAGILRGASVNRISVGVQSFQEAELRMLDRRHRPEDIPRTVQTIRRAGFEHLNLDLIFGIPGQTERSWADSLRRAIDIGPDHVACYGLSYEPGTPLDERRRRGLITPCGEEAEARMYEAAIATLTDAGYEHYEISNFAKPLARCAHNLAYWRNEPYVGIGPGAAGYLDGERMRNVADTEEYIQRVADGRSAVAERERLDASARAGETAMLQLRLIEGLDRAWFERETGFDPMVLFRDAIQAHTAGRRISATPTHIRLTAPGLLISDSIMADFISTAKQGGLTRGLSSG